MEYPIWEDSLFKASMTSAAPSTMWYTDVGLDDRQWFVDEFTNSFMDAYAGKALLVGSRLLSTDAVVERRVWLEETAERAFADFVLAPPVAGNYRNRLLWHRENGDVASARRVGCIMYQVDTHERNAYIAQLFVPVTCQRQGFGSHLITDLVRELEMIVRWHLLVRNVNTAAIQCYTKIGFKRHKNDLCTRYHYNPKAYIEFTYDTGAKSLVKACTTLKLL